MERCATWDVLLVCIFVQCTCKDIEQIQLQIVYRISSRKEEDISGCECNFQNINKEVLLLLFSINYINIIYILYTTINKIVSLHYIIYYI